MTYNKVGNATVRKAGSPKGALAGEQLNLFVPAKLLDQRFNVERGGGVGSHLEIRDLCHREGWNARDERGRCGRCGSGGFGPQRRILCDLACLPQAAVLRGRREANRRAGRSAVDSTARFGVSSVNEKELCQSCVLRAVQHWPFRLKQQLPEPCPRASGVHGGGPPTKPTSASVRGTSR